MTIVVGLALSIVLPGTGLVYLERPRWGLAVGFTCAAGVNAAGVWGFLIPGAVPDWVPWLAVGAAAGAWLVSVAGTAYVAVRRLPARSTADRDALFREGLTAYLRSDLDAAARAFRAIVRLCRGDVEAHLKLAMIHKARGEPRKAMAELRRCRYYDTQDIWRWEVERELAELRSKSSSGR